MDVQIKLLSKNAVMPSYANPEDAGMDLTAHSYEYDYTLDNHIYGLGVSIAIPVGYVGLIFPRSSNSRTGCYLTNHVGVIDSGYTGELKAVFKNRTDPRLVEIINGTMEGPKKPYELGERICQLIIIPYPKIRLVQVDELEPSIRGDGGFGSTGK